MVPPRRTTSRHARSQEASHEPSFRPQTHRRDGPTEIPMLIGGEWRAAAETYEVRDPYRGTVVAHAPRSSLTDLDDALDAAVDAKAKAAAMPGLRARRAAAPRRQAAGRARRSHRRDHGARNRQGDQGRQGRDRALAGHARAVGRRGRAHRRRARAARRQRHGRRQDLLHAALSGRRRRRHHAVQRAGQSRLPQDRAGDRGRKHAWC